MMQPRSCHRIYAKPMLLTAPYFGQARNPHSGGFTVDEKIAKWMKSIDQRLSYAAGQIQALIIAVGCLMKTHPKPIAAANALQRDSEDAMSHLLPSTLDDAFLEGMALVKNRL